MATREPGPSPKTGGRGADPCTPPHRGARDRCDPKGAVAQRASSRGFGRGAHRGLLRWFLASGRRRRRRPRVDGQRRSGHHDRAEPYCRRSDRDCARGKRWISLAHFMAPPERDTASRGDVLDLGFGPSCKAGPRLRAPADSRARTLRCTTVRGRRSWRWRWLREERNRRRCRLRPRTTPGSCRSPRSTRS